MKKFGYIIIISSLILLLGCNSKNRKISETLDTVDAIIEEAPDSALFLLEGLDENLLNSSKQKARYALLKSMALDKNFIDTTTFDVLQPAIDYYSKHGTPNDKLRTFYYQGRIYQNANNDEQALKSFIKAEEVAIKATDSLTLSRLYVAESVLYDRQCMYESLVNSFIQAAKIFKEKKSELEELESLGHALNGALLTNEKNRIDSLFVAVDSLCYKLDTITESIQHAKIIYALDYWDPILAKNLLDSVKEFEGSEIIQMDLTYGNAILGFPEDALKYWNRIKEVPEGDKMKFFSIGALVWERNKNYSKALNYLNSYINISDSINSDLMTDNVISTRVHYDLEKEALLQRERTNHILIYSLLVMLIFLILLIIIITRLKVLKIKSLKLENEKLKLREENRVSEEIREKQSQELNQMKKELGILNSEKEQISLILSEERKIATSVKHAMKNRLVILNGLIASKISSNDKYSLAYRELEDSVENDKAAFMKFIQATLTETNPDFMNLLLDKGLTEMEIKCLCLLALGLRAPEIGSYLGTARHYNLSSSIRKKLGLDSKDMNIGAYIQSMII